MKIKFLPLLVGGLVATSLFFSSCLDNDVEEIVLPDYTSIQSFSIGTVHMEKTTKDSLGKDSTYIDTVSCAHYPFTIDQINRTIENKDSLPVGSDVSRILVDIEADSRAIVYERKSSTGELKDTIWSPTDSIDFTRPVLFKVFAMNGMMGKPYIVKVNVHKQIPDTLEWTHFATPTFATGKLSKQKTMFFKDALYTFGTKADGTPVVESISTKGLDAGIWTEVAVLPEKTNTYSFQGWKEHLFFVADGKLYRLDPNVKGSVEQIGELDNLHSLIGIGNIEANRDALFAYTQDKEMIALEADGSLAIDKHFGFVENKVFNTPRLMSAFYPTRHNKSLTRTLVMGNSAPTDSISSIFGYTTNDDRWSVITMVEPYACPNLENISMVKYDGKLYAFGGGLASKDIKPFEHFYCSTDNGLTWKKVTSHMVFPQQESPKHPSILPFANYYTPGVEGSYSTVVDPQHFIWLVWENGNITRGRLNRLGFAPKW